MGAVTGVEGFVPGAWPLYFMFCVIALMFSLAVLSAAVGNSESE